MVTPRSTKDGDFMACSRVRYGLLLVAVCLAMATSTTARADSETTRAKQLYAQGVTSYNLGHYDEALTAFEMGYRIRQDSAFLFNIGQCQRQLHRYEDAERSYRAYLRESPNLPQSTYDQVQKLIVEMQRAVDEQRAKMPPPGTQPPAESLAQQPPGTQRPTVSTSAEAAPTPSTAPTPSSPPATGRSERTARMFRTAGIGVAAFGVASIVAGGVFYSVAKSANDSVNHPMDGYYSSAAEERRNTFQTLDVVAFVVGGAAAATGTTLYLVGWRRDRRFALIPSAGIGRIGLSLSFKF